MFVAMFITFFSFALLLSHLSSSTVRKIVGYKGIVDVLLHATVIWLFMGTMQGLLQAEAAAICFSLYLRGYHWALGYERIVNGRWQRYAGKFT